MVMTADPRLPRSAVAPRARAAASAVGRPGREEHALQLIVHLLGRGWWGRRRRRQQPYRPGAAAPRTAAAQDAERRQARGPDAWRGRESSRERPLTPEPEARHVWCRGGPGQRRRCGRKHARPWRDASDVAARWSGEAAVPDLGAAALNMTMNTTFILTT